VPGFAWTWLFFKKDKIGWIERITLSVGLSIALVPLTVLWLNLIFHMGITLLNVTLAVCVLSVLPVAYLYGMDYYRKRRGLKTPKQADDVDSDESQADDCQE